MKSRSSVALLLVLAAQGTFAAVDPRLLGLVMPDAKVVFGIQVDQSQSSPFGQYLLSQVSPGADFDKLIAATGFDPRRDLHEVLGATVDGQGGLIVGRGTFQPARLAAAAVLAGASTSIYQGIEILSNNNGPKPGSVAFLDTATVVAGDPAAVKAAINRRFAGQLFSGPLAEKAMAVSTINDAWFATLAPPGSFLPGAIPNLNQIPLDAALQASGGVKFAASAVTLSAEVVARSSQDAQALVDVGKFLASMVQMNRDKNPGASKIATLADAATFAASGSVATVSVTLPEQQVEKLLMPAARSAKPKRIAAR